MTSEMKIKIDELRNEGLGYSKIVNLLGITKNSVASYCIISGGISISSDMKIISCLNCGKPIILADNSKVTEGIKPSAKQLVSFRYDNDNVLVIHINEGIKKPYYVASTIPRPSGTYIRVGRSKQQLTDEEILFMLMDSMKISFEKEIAETHLNSLQN